MTDIKNISANTGLDMPPVCLDACIQVVDITSPEALVLERLLRDLGITGPPRGAFTLLGPDSIYQISL